MSARDRLLIGIAGCLALTAAMWFFVLTPKREQAAELGTQVTQAESKLADASARAVTAEQAQATYGRDYATVARLGKAVPAKVDVASLVFQLESAARRAKVDLRSISVEARPVVTPVVTPPAAGAAPPAATTPPATGTDGGAASTAGVEPAPFSFSFEGDYFSLRRLLDAIDRFSQVKGTKVAVSGRLLTIESVVLAAGRDGLPQVKAQVLAKAYIAPLPAALPTDATALPASLPPTTTGG